MTLRRLLVPLLALVLLAACSALQTQHQKIGAACETIASGLDAVTAAKVSGQATKAQLDDAIRVYKPTKSFCEPVAMNLSAVDYAALLRAAATLTTKSAEVQR